MFAGFATAMTAAIRIEWGWALMFIGLGLLIASSLLKPEAQVGEDPIKNQTIGEWAQSEFAIKRVKMPNWTWVVVCIIVMSVVSFSFSRSYGAPDMSGGKGQMSAQASTQKTVSDATLQAYIANSMAISDLKAGMHDSVLDGKVPGVEFRVKNNGDRPLKKVEVTVYFKDKDGKTIYEQKYTPISHSNMDGDKVLKTNYIWQLEKGKFYTAKSVPSEWAAGVVDAKITAIEFADDKDLMPDMAANSPEKLYAQNSLEVYEVKTGMYNSILDGQTPGLEFKIKNKGDKNLSELAVVAYFKDNEGNIIHEQIYYPISSTSFDGSKVLKSGQIWQLERGKFYTSKSLPAEWNGSSAIVEISRIKFE
jgi:hypothetical protein